MRKPMCIRISNSSLKACVFAKSITTYLRRNQECTPENISLITKSQHIVQLMFHSCKESWRISALRIFVSTILPQQ